MSRTKSLLIAGVLQLLAGGAAWADSSTSGLLSVDQIRRFGLERAWFTHVDVDPSQGRVTHLAYYVSKNDIHTVFEVRYGNRRQVFSERDLDRWGAALGLEGAQKKAEALVEELKAQNPGAKAEAVRIPEITLYATTDRAVVHAIDAETGRTRWAAVIGDRNAPTEIPGTSEAFLAVLNGSDLFLLKRATGEIAWQRRIKGVAGAGPAITDDYVVVPTISGNVELYKIKETRTIPELYKSNGRVLVPPIVTPRTLTWPTDRGFVYVARSNKKGLRYRAESQDAIVCQPAYAPPNSILFTAIDGYVYCHHESSGDEQWVFSTGEPISNTPVPLAESVYVVTDKKTMFCLDLKTGQEKWSSPHVKQFISASKDRLYALSDTGRLMILDAKVGGRIASMMLPDLEIIFFNLQTDRLILGMRTGVIQCLRETELPWPLVHQGVPEAKPEETPEEEEEAKPGPKKPSAPPKAKPAEESKPAEDQAPAANPFGGDDPFGGGGMGGAKPKAKDAGGQDKDAGEAENPFGGMAPADDAGAGKKEEKKDAGGDKEDPFK